MEEQKNLIDEVKELDNLLERDGYKDWCYQRLTTKKLIDFITVVEAERSEVRNKVIELEQTIRKIQDKAIELYGNQIELP